MKHIVHYSGGAASAVVAERVVQKYGVDDTILLFTPTYAEHPDADRFRKQVADYLGMSITVVEDGRTLWELIDDQHCLPSHFIPFCTRILKQAPGDKYKSELAKSEEITCYYGYGVDEYRRYQLMSNKSIYPVGFPLVDERLTGDDAKRIIRKEWGICLPEPYKHLNHNNCIPCWKGGKGHFRAVAKYYPEQYERACQAEEKCGHTVFKDCTLRELAGDTGQLEMEIEPILCMCGH